MISNALDVVDAEYSSNIADSVTVLKTITEVASKKMKKMNSVDSVLFYAQDSNSSDDESEAEIGVNNEISNQIDEQLLLFPNKSIRYNVTERENIIYFIFLFQKIKSLSVNKGEKLENNSIERRM